MEKRFLRSYMDLLVQTCHRRGALATGGMAALLLPQDRDSDSYRTALATVTRQAQCSLHSCTNVQLNYVGRCVAFYLFAASLTHFPNMFRLKLLEIKAGVDGFMVYDLGLIDPMHKVRTLL